MCVYVHVCMCECVRACACMYVHVCMCVCVCSFNCLQVLNLATRLSGCWHGQRYHMSFRLLARAKISELRFHFKAAHN